MACRWCPATVATHRVSGWKGRICDECHAKHTVVCSHCRKNSRKSSSHSVGDKTVCYVCIREKYVKCNLCNKFHLKGTVATDNGFVICSDCMEKGAKKCTYCKSWFIGEKDYCSRCAPATCSSCNKEFPKNQARYGILGVKHGNNCFCRDCYQPFTKLTHQYSVAFKKKGNSKIFFGVELEFELHHCPDEIKAISAIDFSGEDRLIKTDCSLREGIELISQPCSLAYHKNNFQWEKLCKTLKGLGCNTSRRCGLHIHMSRDFFTEEQEKKLYWFIYKHVKTISKLAGRNPTHYAGVLYNDPCDSGFNCREHDKYSLLDFIHDKTIEFRLPQGTLNHKRILSLIEFCDAAAHYSKGHSLTAIQTGSWESFLTWLTKAPTRREKYKNLIKTLTPRKVKAKPIITEGAAPARRRDAHA